MLIEAITENGAFVIPQISTFPSGNYLVSSSAPIIAGAVKEYRADVLKVDESAVLI